MGTMQRLFQLMAEKKASDIFVSVGAPINIKINGVAMPINQQIMDAATITGLLQEILTEEQIEEFEETLELNTGYALAGRRQLPHLRVLPAGHAGHRGALHPGGHSAASTRSACRRC